MPNKEKKAHLYFPFSLRVFLIIIVLIIIPVYLMFLYLNHTFVGYMEDEISSRAVQNIDNSQEEIARKMENLINVSNFFVSDPEYEAVMTNSKNSRYQKSCYFDAFVNKLGNSNMFDLDELKITYFDEDKNIYTNWGVNYHDYSFLLHEEWVQKSVTDRGYLTWNMFGSSYIQEEKGKGIRYVSMARPLLTSTPESGDRASGMLIISLNERVLDDLLQKYTYSDGDRIFFYSHSAGLFPPPAGDPVLNGEDAWEILNRVDGTRDNFMDFIHGSKYMVSYYTLSTPWNYGGSDLKVVAMMDYQNLAEKTNGFLMKITVLFLMFICLMLAVVWAVVNAIVKPVKDISGKLSDYQVGNILVYNYHRNDEIGQLYAAFDKMTGNIEDLFYRLGEEYEIKEKYRFESLRAQLNPHFIFNTLNSIRWMAIIKKQDNIMQSIDAMTNMLQYSMGKGGEFVTLGQELSSVNSYLFIQNLRYGERYELHMDIPRDLLDCQAIKFSLQPIVENCIIHGFSDFAGKGEITVSGRREGNRLQLFVENNGNAISDEAIRKFEENKTGKKRDEKKFTGIGMTNVDEMIRITYGEEFGLHLLRRGGNTVVCYTLPYRKQETEIDEENHDR
ncbi:cache domain-containing sensor histidine kinase [Caproiciproducens sp.]